MEMDFRRAYATLVGRVDAAITDLEEMIEQGNFDWAHTIRVTEALKNALLEAENRYIAASESDDHD